MSGVRPAASAETEAVPKRLRTEGGAAAAAAAAPAPSFLADLQDMVADMDTDPDNVGDVRATWKRPALPPINPAKDRLTFQQLELDHYLGDPLPGMPSTLRFTFFFFFFFLWLWSTNKRVNRCWPHQTRPGCAHVRCHGERQQCHVCSGVISFHVQLALTRPLRPTGVTCMASSRIFLRRHQLGSPRAMFVFENGFVYFFLLFVVWTCSAINF